MERQVEMLRGKMLDQRTMIDERDFLINKLKVRNMDLEMSSRGRVKVRSESRQLTERSRREIPTTRIFDSSKEHRDPHFLKNLG